MCIDCMVNIERVLHVHVFMMVKGAKLMLMWNKDVMKLFSLLATISYSTNCIGTGSVQTQV